MSDVQPRQPPLGASAPRGGLPQRGAFATSEVLPLIQQAQREVSRLGGEWQRLRTEADQKASDAKRIRANLIVTLRTFGNEVTDAPIKTSAERNEWANADADVIQAELEADLAQTVQMSAREAYHDAQGYYETLRQMLSVERDEWKREHGGPHQ